MAFSFTLAADHADIARSGLKSLFQDFAVILMSPGKNDNKRISIYFQPFQGVGEVC